MDPGGSRLDAVLSAARVWCMLLGADLVAVVIFRLSPYCFPLIASERGRCMRRRCRHCSDEADGRYGGAAAFGPRYAGGDAGSGCHGFRASNHHLATRQPTQDVRAAVVGTATGRASVRGIRGGRRQRSLHDVRLVFRCAARRVRRCRYAAEMAGVYHVPSTRVSAARVR